MILYNRNSWRQVPASQRWWVLQRRAVEVGKIIAISSQVVQAKLLHVQYPSESHKITSFGRREIPSYMLDTPSYNWYLNPFSICSFVGPLDPRSIPASILLF
jgi:hypothetical protein